MKSKIVIPRSKQHCHIKKVALFGSADIDRQHPLYKEAFSVARFLAYHGKTVVDGGGPGVMEAATRGAESADGHTVAVTFYPKDMPEFEGRSEHNVPDIEVKTANYIERMFGLMDESDAFICFQGGTGTLSEWATAWLLAHLYYGNHKPLILYGEFWHEVMDVINDYFFIGEKELEVYRVVKNKDELVAALDDLEKELQERCGLPTEEGLAAGHDPLAINIHLNSVADHPDLDDSRLRPNRVLTIGSALVDIYIHSESFQLQEVEDKTYLCQVYGDKVEVEKFHYATGGGGSNTAVGFARLGFETSVISETGRDVWSDSVLADLKREHVGVEFVQSERTETTGGSVILVAPQGGGRTVLVHRGAASELDPHDIPVAEFQRVRWVHLSSISGRLETLQTIFAAAQAAKAQHPEFGLSWNPGSRELAALNDGQLKFEDTVCDVLLMNQTEWDSLGQQQQAHQVAEQIVITQGKKGGQVWENGQLVHEYASQPVEAIEETGAGDAFATGFVAARLRGLPLEYCCQAGSHNAASVVQQFGAKAGLLRKLPVQ